MTRKNEFMQTLASLLFDLSPDVILVLKHSLADICTQMHVLSFSMLFRA